MFNCMNMFSNFGGSTKSYPIQSSFLGGFPIFGILNFIIFAALIYFAVTFIVSKLTPVTRKSESVSDILNKKFALGEISEEEFLHKKSILDE